MGETDAVVGTQRMELRRELLCRRKLETWHHHRDDIATADNGVRDLSTKPVSRVATTIKGTRREHEEEVVGSLNPGKQSFVEGAGLVVIDIEEAIDPAQLEFRTKQPSHLQSVLPTVTDEERLSQQVPPRNGVYPTAFVLASLRARCGH